MTGLLEMREKLRTFYGKYELYVTAGLKFVLGLVVFSVINGNIGYMERLNQPAAVLLLSLLCAFFPINAMVVLAIYISVPAFSVPTISFVNFA